MPKVSVILTGDKELDRMLLKLERTTARKLHRTASRTAAKLIVQEAKRRAPAVSGDDPRSLTVRSLRRSRRGMGYRVTQKELRAKSGKKAKIFYGSFLEFGWTTRHKPGGEGRKITGQWLMKQAGDRKEREAIKLYRDELRRLIEEAK